MAKYQWRALAPNGDTIAEGRSYRKAQAFRNARWAALEASEIRPFDPAPPSFAAIMLSSERWEARNVWARRHGHRSYAAYLFGVTTRRQQFADACSILVYSPERLA